jgi:hypothetical protein
LSETVVSVKERLVGSVPCAVGRSADCARVGPLTSALSSQPRPLRSPPPSPSQKSMQVVELPVIVEPTNDVSPPV